MQTVISVQTFPPSQNNICTVHCSCAQTYHHPFSSFQKKDSNPFPYNFSKRFPKKKVSRTIMFAKNNNNDRFPSPFREITIANIVEKKKGRRRRKMKSRRGEKKNIRGNFSLTNSMIHALARARNIKKHFEETKAQRGERRGEGMDGKIETIADSWIRGTIRYPRVIPREKSVTRYG